jgi:proteasome alpha subunit
MYRLTYDGTIVDEPEFLAMGGQADTLTNEMRSSFAPGLPLRDALGLAVRSLAAAGGTESAPRTLPASQLEVAVLDRTRGKRKFRRLTGLALTELLPGNGGGAPPPAESPEGSGADGAGSA